jgi:hypothetical protein
MSGKQPRPLPRAKAIEAKPPTPQAPVIGEPVFAPAKKPERPAAPAVKPAQPGTGFIVAEQESVAARAKRKKSPLASPLGLVVAGVVLLLIAGGSVAALLFTSGQGEPLALAPIGEQTVVEQELLSVRLQTDSASAESTGIEFALHDAPPGAAIKGGVFTWTPDEAQGPGKYRVVVSARRGEENSQVEFAVTVSERNQPPAFEPIAMQTIESGRDLSVQAAARDLDVPAGELVYEMKSGPPEARIDPLTGWVTWRTSGPARRVSIVVAAREKGTGGVSTTTAFDVEVLASTVPVRDVAAEMAERLRGAGITATAAGTYSRPGIAVEARRFQAGSELLEVYDFGTPDAAQEAIAQLAAIGRDEAKRSRRGYRADGLLVVYEGDAARLVAQLDAAFGVPAFHRPLQVAAADPLPATIAPPAATEPAADETTRREDEQILALHENKQLFTPAKSYPALRAIFAARFERAHRAEIDAAFDEDLQRWLTEHPDVKEELLTAIAPEDNLPAVLRLFAALWSKHPAEFEEYWNAAVAVAVTWDGNRMAIEDYRHHQTRCKAVLPDALVGAEQNFAYLLGTDSGRYLPWEFLVYVVNHETPLDERQWAVANYLPKRLMIGECYGDVPYDKTMLETGSAVCRLNGQGYTLANLRQYGGVCAMQADFASRVGKSLGIPAAYVRGESNSGDMHAWVEWVVLKQVGPQRIVFSLESHGRYRGDKYYVGELDHPQTGREITDRAMELELQTVGLDPRARRHSQRVLAAWPAIAAATKASARDELAFLGEVAKLCPGNTDAWRKIAALTRAGAFDAKTRRLPEQALGDLFRTFANFPDFTWTVFDDMVAFEPDLKKRIGFYERLLGLYIGAQRPDLAAAARLKLTDMLLEDGQRDAAGNGLVQTLLAFADDGRYVRPMLDKLESICGTGAAEAAIMDAFWNVFLPRVPQMRGDEPTPHAISMHQRAIAWFTSRGNAQAVQSLQAELAKIQAGQGKRS